MVAGLLRWAAGAMLKRLDAQDVRIGGLEAALADLRGDLRVNATENKHLREVLHALQTTLERSR